MAIVHLALGANLGDPVAQIRAALGRLHDRETSVRRAARVYRSAPIGPPGQPDYVNSAVEVETTLEPLALLDRLKAIEAELGRTEGARWGPRVIDLDLALWGDRVVDHPRLVVPHRELTRRRFVLAPLADLVPGAVVPGTEQTVAALLAGLGKAPDELSVIEGVDILG